MARVPAAVSRAAQSAGLGEFERRYRGPVGASVYFGLVLVVFALCPGINGAPWFIYTVPAAGATALLTVAVLTAINRAAFLYAGGLVYTRLNGRIKLVVPWSGMTDFSWVDRRVFFIFTLTTLRWTEYSVKAAGRPVVTFTTTHRDDTAELGYVVVERLRSLR